jgi:hypothetical protein
MRENLLNIINHSIKNNLSINQSIYLFCLKENINNCPINAEELLKLSELKLVLSSKITNLALISIDNLDKNIKFDERLPILSENSGNFLKILAEHFMSDGIKEKEFSYLNSYLNNSIMVPFFYLFLELFPTSDKEKNKKWREHFGDYDNVTLRRISNGTVRKFKQIWKSKDIGLFLLGTYMFITQSFNEDKKKYFIKNIENYLSEHQEWYNQASDFKFKQGKNKNKEESFNTFSI